LEECRGSLSILSTERETVKLDFEITRCLEEAVYKRSVEDVIGSLGESVAKLHIRDVGTHDLQPYGLGSICK